MPVQESAFSRDRQHYAQTFAERFRGVAAHPFEQGFDLRLVPEKLSQPLAWRRPRRIFVGVSVEKRDHGLRRLDTLRETPATVRFVSVEPLLEDLGAIDLTGIHWVIAGGESGPGARRMLEAWVLGIERQCRAQSVPFFFKQWGEYASL